MREKRPDPHQTPFLLLQNCITCSAERARHGQLAADLDAAAFDGAQATDKEI